MRRLIEEARYSVLASKASSAANMTLRVFTSRDSKLLMRAFKTYVRRILEYACEVVNPYLACDVETLERVQRDCTRRVILGAGIEYTDYTTMIGCIAQRYHCLLNGAIMLAY